MVETQIDCFEDNDEATAFMESEAFVRNPAGVEFDPEELCRRVEVGEPKSEIVFRPEGEIARQKH